MKKYFLFIIVFLMLVSNVKAANSYELISEGYRLKNGLEIKRIMVNNEIAFCIQPGVLEGTSNYKQQDFEKEYQGLNAKIKKEIQKIGLYAKYYYDSKKKTNYYYAGQEMIWNLLGKQEFIFAKDLSKEKKEIQNGVTNFENISKYASGNYKIKGGDVLELKDDFSDFEISNKSDFEKQTGLKVSLNKDKLIIENPTDNLIKKKVSLQFTKFKSKFSKGISYAHYNSVYQDYVSVSDNFKINMAINFETEVALGGFKGKKVNENNEGLKDVEFSLYQGEKEIKKFKTDENGYFQINNLSPGKYYLQESSTYDYLVLDNKKYEIVVEPKKIYEVNKGEAIINYFKKGRVLFYKHGLKLNEESKPLKDVAFGIYNEDQELLQEIVSNEEGLLVSDYLIYGKYFLKEIKSIEDYLLDEQFYDFEINSEEDLIFNEGKPFINKAKEYQLKIKKMDGESKKPLEKVSFNIKGDNFDKDLISDEKGEINLKLNKGCYNIKEVKALDGYIKKKDNKEICLEKDEEIEFLNYQYFQVDTGFKKPNSIYIVIGFGLISIVLLTLKLTNKRISKK